jgi:feruloyl esterase
MYIILVALLSAAPCDSLKSLSLPNTTITLAQTVAAGQFTPSGGGGGRGAAAFREVPEFCRVAATLKPTSDSDIKMEIWMPTAGWNGNFQAAGNGGLAGSIGFAAMGGFVRNGFAAAGTDTGHEGMTGEFIIGHPEKLKDYAYRAFHEMTATSKAVIAAYYGNGPKLSVLNNSGGGGRQALSEAERYPADYDVIAVPGTIDVYATKLHFGQTWVYEATHKTQASHIPPEKYPAIHRAALDKCDALVDGVKDGLIDNPASCAFDPKVIECKGTDSPTCLTPAQVEAARMIYTPVTHSRTKERLYSPLFPGSELGWAGMAGPELFPNAEEYFQWVVFQDPNWDYKKRPVNYDSDWALANKPEMVAIMNADNPDMSAFAKRGGKLLVVGGWADTGTAPGGSVDYYKSVVKKMGEKRTRDFFRLFMVPGMGHQMGTNGVETFNFDSLTVVMEWRETGKAPDQLVATRYQNGKEVGKRLICAYPQVAVYKGSGAQDDPANFTCKVPKP